METSSSTSSEVNKITETGYNTSKLYCKGGHMNAKNFYQKTYQRFRRIADNQAGITGLETAIVLIAFIVVAAVFAFTVLTTGLFTTEKAKQTAQAGVGETQSTLTLKGSVIATATEEDCPGDEAICLKTITFKLGQAAGSDPVDLEPLRTLITYSDANNQEIAAYASSGDPRPYTRADVLDALEDAEDPVNWGNRWLLGAGETVDSGEIVEFTLNLLDMGASIEANREFHIEVIPAQGAVIPVVRITPLELKPAMDLN
jgi:flagellin FlaB